MTGFDTSQHNSIISAMTFQAYCRKHPEACGHPTQKPLKLVHAILVSIKGHNVLDPFAGSGTTGRACKDLGRRCLMIEIEEKWAAVAANRLKQEVLFW